MPDESGDATPPDGDDTSENAFSLVGNEIRAAMLRVIAGEGDVSFSEIRSGVPMDLDPGRANYHLQQLVGPLVEQTDTGYRLHAAGYRVNRALQAVTFPRQDSRTVAADFDCHICGSMVAAHFQEGFIRIQCPDCEYTYFTDVVEPPLETFEGPQAAFAHCSRYTQYRILAYADGICRTCGTAVEPGLQPPAEVPMAAKRDRKVSVYLSCTSCGTRADLTVGMALLTDRVLRSFCADHGVDVLSTPYWELGFAATDTHVSVTTTDPWDVTLRVPFDDEVLELAVDDNLTVTDRQRLDDPAATTPTLPPTDACLRLLRRHRWPDGVRCPRCDSAETIKKGASKKDAQRYRCRDCERMFNDLSGTLFAEHRLTIPEMFHIVRRMDTDSVASLSRQLDRSYGAVLNFVHEVEAAQGTAAEPITQSLRRGVPVRTEGGSRDAPS